MSSLFRFDNFVNSNSTAQQGSLLRQDILDARTLSSFQQSLRHIKPN